jgi:hypothetical protein
MTDPDSRGIQGKPARGFTAGSTGNHGVNTHPRGIEGISRAASGIEGRFDSFPGSDGHFPLEHAALRGMGAQARILRDGIGSGHVPPISAWAGNSGPRISLPQVPVGPRDRPRMPDPAPVKTPMETKGCLQLLFAVAYILSLSRRSLNGRILPFRALFSRIFVRRSRHPTPGYSIRWFHMLQWK